MEFFDKLPNWLRWILLIPSVIVLVAIGVLVFYIIMWITGGWSDWGWVSNIIFIILTAVACYLTLVFSAAIAPKGEFIVALIFGILLTIVAIIFFIFLVSAVTQGFLGFNLFYFLITPVCILTIIFELKSIKVDY